MRASIEGEKITKDGEIITPDEQLQLEDIGELEGLDDENIGNIGEEINDDYNSGNTELSQDNNTTTKSKRKTLEEKLAENEGEQTLLKKIDEENNRKKNIALTKNPPKKEESKKLDYNEIIDVIGSNTLKIVKKYKILIGAITLGIIISAVEAKNIQDERFSIVDKINTIILSGEIQAYISKQLIRPSNFISQSHAIYSGNVYYDYKLIDGANIDTFEVLSDELSMDDKNIYVRNNISYVLDRQSYRYLGGGYGVQGEMIYFNDIELENADYSSFRYLSRGLGADNRNTFLNGELLEGHSGFLHKLIFDRNNGI